MALVLRKAVLPKNISLWKCLKGRSLITATNKRHPASLSTPMPLGSAKQLEELKAATPKKPEIPECNLESVRSAVSCPNLLALALPCTAATLPPGTRSIDHESSWNCLNRSPVASDLLKSVSTHSLSVRNSSSKACCPDPCCCGNTLPPPCNQPPKCVQYMTGYYYYPYGFWFCGPYHVTGCCVPLGATGKCCPPPASPPCPAPKCCVCLSPAATLATTAAANNVLQASASSTDFQKVQSMQMPFSSQQFMPDQNMQQFPYAYPFNQASEANKADSFQQQQFNFSPFVDQINKSVTSQMANMPASQMPHQMAAQMPPQCSQQPNANSMSQTFHHYLHQPQTPPHFGQQAAPTNERSDERSGPAKICHKSVPQANRLPGSNAFTMTSAPVQQRPSQVSSKPIPPNVLLYKRSDAIGKPEEPKASKSSASGIAKFFSSDSWKGKKPTTLPPKAASAFPLCPFCTVPKKFPVFYTPHVRAEKRVVKQYHSKTRRDEKLTSKPSQSASSK